MYISWPSIFWTLVIFSYSLNSSNIEDIDKRVENHQFNVILSLKNKTITYSILPTCTPLAQHCTLCRFFGKKIININYLASKKSINFNIYGFATNFKVSI